MADKAAQFCANSMVTFAVKFRDLWNTNFPDNKLTLDIWVDVSDMPCFGLQGKEADFMSIWFDVVGFDGLGHDNKNRVWEIRYRPEFRKLIVEATHIHEQLVKIFDESRTPM